jgi:CheY-like chemotaxis protein
MPRILVVEDNLLNRKLTVLVLEKAGHSVLQASDAESGLEMARAELPDLILMDIQLPGMSGLDAVGLLKQGDATRSIPVLALTAMAMKGDAARIAACGCAGYITKPLRYQELWAAIDAHLPMRGKPST